MRRWVSIMTVLNKIKGGEMMIATYVGFSSVSLMCMMWLLLPYHSPNMVWGMAGKGLRTTISLEGYYTQALAKILQINIGNLMIPTGAILFFIVLAFAMWAFLHTKTGTAMTAVGSNPEFASLIKNNIFVLTDGTRCGMILFVAKRVRFDNIYERGSVGIGRRARLRIL